MQWCIAEYKCLSIFDMINLGFYGPHKRNQKVFSWMTSWRIINLRVVFFVVLFVATTCGMMMCFAGETRLLFMPWSSDTFHEMTRSIKQRLQARRAALLLPLLIISCVGLFIQKTSTNWKLEESDRWQSSDKFSSEHCWVLKHLLSNAEFLEYFQSTI